MDVPNYTLSKKLPCEICSGKMHYIKRTLCESGHTEIEMFSGMDRKTACDKIMSVTKCDKKDVEQFIDLLISVGAEIGGERRKTDTIDNGLDVEPVEDINDER